MADGVTAEQIIINISNSMGAVGNLVLGVAYMLGVVLIAAAFFKLRKLADYQRGMFQPQEALSPFVNLVIGAGLVWMPAMFSATSETLFGGVEASVLSVGSSAAQSGISPEVIKALHNVLAVIGMIAFVRGMMIITSSASGHGGQQGGLAKGITHIVGGVMCYHIDKVYSVLLATLGITGIV